MNGSPCCSPGGGALPVVPGATADATTGATGAPGVRDGTRTYAPRVRLPGGVFRMGGEDADANPGDHEGPVREVTVAGFTVDAYAVTNARFTAFVADTGHRTDAERFGWSYVFAAFLPDRLRDASPRPDSAPWWCAVAGAHWRTPEGPGSGLEGRGHHPVVHVSWRDARAFCAWDGGRLPTEAEWEYAARGGLDQARYPWGDELTPGGEHRCNVWQGVFPEHDTADDGYAGTAPVDAYAPNGYGLHNVSGNVWEWSADTWSPGDPRLRATRGGSYLCHHSYCNRYRVAARTANTPDSSAGNLGFRVFRSADAP